MTVVLNPGGPRSELLVAQSYEEEDLACPDVDERVAPIKLLYPRSFVESVERMSGAKVHDFCFIGSLYRPETFGNRRWIVDFAAQHFTHRSYLLITDGDADHRSIGSFDRTGVETDVFVPKETPPRDRAFFHHHYFQIMRSSEFTLCPAGDLPWSMRFFEAIMCRSIPIVADSEHVGRNELERSIGYRVMLRDDEHIYDESIAEENYRLFLQNQTLIPTGALR